MQRSLWCLLVAVTVTLQPRLSLAQEDFDLLLFIPALVKSLNSGSSGPASTSTLNPGSSSSAVNLCQGLRLNDFRNRPMQNLSRPSPGSAYIDPSFGTRVVRISDATRVNSNIVKTMYSTVQAWNADETRMILYHVGDGHHLYDGRSYEYISRLNISPADLEQVYWDTGNPDVLRYINRASGVRVQTAGGQVTLRGDELMQYNVRTRRYRVVRQLDALCPQGNLTAGNDSQGLDLQSNVWGLRCANQALSHIRSTNTTHVMNGSAEYMAPQAFPGGRFHYHRGAILNSRLELVRRLDLGNPAEHANLGRTHDGRDAYFAVAFNANNQNRCGNGVGSLVMHHADDASCRVLIGPANGYPYTLSGTHVNAMSYRNPGWVVISSIGYTTQGDSLLEQELVLANTDPRSPQVCRVAHHRATGRLGSIGYFAEPHPVLSPTGTRVLFSSDWSNSGQVDVYVVETPAYQR